MEAAHRTAPTEWAGWLGWLGLPRGRLQRAEIFRALRPRPASCGAAANEEPPDEKSPDEESPDEECRDEEALKRS